MAPTPSSFWINSMTWENIQKTSGIANCNLNEYYGIIQGTVQSVLMHTNPMHFAKKRHIFAAIFKLILFYKAVCYLHQQTKSDKLNNNVKDRRLTCATG